MSSSHSFWKRMGNAFRGGETREVYDSNNDGGVGVTPASANGGSASILPWGRKQKAIERLDEGYQRVLELMDGMRRHFEAQDVRAAALADGITRVGATLEQLADVQRAQCDGIRTMTSRVDVAAKYAGDLATMLVEMPASLQAQAEAVHAVARQMEATRDADGELTHSLRQFSQAADSLRDSGTAQVDSLHKLHMSQGSQEERLRNFVRGQTRLLLVITVIVAILGAGAIAALAVVVHMLFNNGGQTFT